MSEQNMHKIEFRVQLTGSDLFDIHSMSVAVTICNKYPGLHYDYHPDHILIYGELNDYWFDRWNTEVFNRVGEAY